MPAVAIHRRAQSAARRRVLLLCLASAFVAGGSAVPARPVAAEVLAVQTRDPEAMLIDVYKELAGNRLRQAQRKADALVEAYPNFRLGHLIRGDLLLMHTRPVSTLGAVEGSEEKLKGLRHEAMARLKYLRERPDPNLVPRPLLQLRDDQKHALVVDAGRSRLYVYENQGGQLRFATDYYISQGKYGANKLREGDQRTPIGIYYITGRVAPSRLPEFYGAGALPINYPNEWDRLHGRSGSGIWLHGTPSDSFSRPPLSSDGCVVLTNPDLHKLARSVQIGVTPVVISENVEFVSRAQSEADRKVAAQLLEDWRGDVESLSRKGIMGHYSPLFRSERGEDLETWFANRQALFPRAKGMSVALRQVSHFFYPGRDDLIVSTFTQDTVSAKRTHSIRKRQFWAKEGAGWKIIYELVI